MKKRILPFLFIAFVLAISFTSVTAQESPYSLRLTRDWGYGQGADINGRVSLSVRGDAAQIQEVTFMMDGEVMEVAVASPFKLQFDTNNFDPGLHRLTAEVLTISGEMHTTNAIASNFVEKGAANQSILRTLLILGGVVLVSQGLQFLMRKNAKKGVKVGESGKTQYGAFGGSVCPNCGQPFQRYPLGLNLGGHRLQICPHCKKLVAAQRAKPQELEAAELRFRSEATDPTDPQTDLQQKQKDYDDSKYTDL